MIRQPPQSDQALVGALQNFNQLWRAVGLAISIAVTSIIDGHDNPGDPLLLRGIKAGEWVNISMATLAYAIILHVFRDFKKAGAESRRSRCETRAFRR